jgi:imidazolonepropionase-like amidohydrolase
MLAKNDVVLEAGYRSLEICKRAGVPVAYGSDLLGPLQEERSREFLIRREVMKPIEVIRSATTVAARVLRREGTLGVIAPGALADLLLVDGNPLLDLGLFQNQGAHLTAIMKGGTFHKNLLS